MLSEFLRDKNDLKLNYNYKIFPDIEDREFWNNAKENSHVFFDKMYEMFGKKEKKHLTASLYRAYSITGNRSDFENIYFQRRCELITKVFFECMYNDGRFMEGITDLVWMILEESTWCIPAHCENVEKGDFLPDYKVHTLDIFSAETACIMAFVYQTLGSRLDEVSKVIKRRIKDRVNNFILDDYLKRDDYWWMGFMGGIPNNWCPWINSNILVSAVILADEEKLKKIVCKVIKSVDIYIEKQPVDGGCDEGASYWNLAGLTMLECLWLIKNITGGQLDFLKEEQSVNSLEYFMKVYTGKGECVNFADSGTKLPIYYASIYKFAKLTENEQVKQFSKQLYNDAPLLNIENMGERRSNGIATKVLRMLDVATYMGEIKKLKESEIQKNDYYIESINVMTSKAYSNPLKGLYFAVKGGHNDESHNHNDVGTFIVYKNGEKFIVDIGCMVYSKITFSNERYTLFTTRSAYHNVPLIDKKEQKNGRMYEAKNTKYKNEKERVTFSLDISDAYENKSDIEKWERIFEHNKKDRKIKVTEDFSFLKSFEYELRFATPCNVKLKDEGLILTSKNGETLNMDFDVKKLEFSLETLELEDAFLKNEWGEKLYIITLKANASKDKLSYILY